MGDSRQQYITSGLPPPPPVPMSFFGDFNLKTNFGEPSNAVFDFQGPLYGSDVPNIATKTIDNPFSGSVEVSTDEFEQLTNMPESSKSLADPTTAFCTIERYTTIDQSLGQQAPFRGLAGFIYKQNSKHNPNPSFLTHVGVNMILARDHEKYQKLEDVLADFTLMGPVVNDTGASNVNTGMLVRFEDTGLRTLVFQPFGRVVMRNVWGGAVEPGSRVGYILKFTNVSGVYVVDQKQRSVRVSQPRFVFQFVPYIQKSHVIPDDDIGWLEYGEKKRGIYFPVGIAKSRMHVDHGANINSIISDMSEIDKTYEISVYITGKYQQVY